VLVLDHFFIPPRLTLVVADAQYIPALTSRAFKRDNNAEMRQGNGLKRATITDVAAEVGVSVCTVNKALHGKPKVSEATRRRVCAAARRLGYRPNRLAQALARKPMVLGVLHPEAWSSYYAPFLEGIQQGIRRLDDHKVEVRFLPLCGSPAPADLALAIEEVAADGLDGLLVLRTFPSPALREAWAGLRERGIPFVFVGTEDPASPRLTSVRLDCRRCGRMAAELLALLTGGQPVAIVVERRDLLTFREKVEGFRREAARLSLPLTGVFEVGDQPNAGHGLAERIFSMPDPPRGVYLATENSVAFGRYVSEHPARGEVKVVGSGVFPRMRAFLRQRIVHVTFDQNPRRQGQLAVEVLYRFLAEGSTPPHKILVEPLVVLPGNVDLASGATET
jgi:LacI family transcriptional regulator